MKHLVSTDWLEINLENVRIFDASWHLPNSNRNALNEFKSAHIKNSNFFDIDKHSNKKKIYLICFLKKIIGKKLCLN